MKKVAITFILSLLVNIMLFAQTADYKQNTVIVKIKNNKLNDFIKSDTYRNISSVFGHFSFEQEFPTAIKPKEVYNKYGQKCVDITNIYRLTFDNQVNVTNIVKSLSKSNLVEYAEPLFNVQLLDMPNDPFLLPENVNSDGAYQYWTSNIHAFDGWDICKGDTTIIIGISDTGTALSHDDLAGNIKYNYADPIDGVDNDGDGYVDNFYGWNFALDDNNTQVPQQGESRLHGAFVSSVSSAIVNNGIGVAGAGYKCKFVPLRIMDNENTLVNSYQSIVYAANHHFDVVNCSWGSTSFQQMGQDVIWYATVNNDLLVVAAAGNEGVEGKFYPASYENVLSVAAVNANDEKWSGSSFATTVDVSAPGTMFVGTSENGYATLWSGTSFASPIVAGCAGILRSFYPHYNAQQITEIIKASADNIDTLSRIVPDSVMAIDSTLIDGIFVYDTTYIDATYRYFFNSDFANMLGTGRINLYNALTIPNEKKYSTLLSQIATTRQDTILGLSGLLTNYLNQRSNLKLYLSTESHFVTIIDSVLQLTDMQTMQTDSLQSILFAVSQDAPQELIIKVKLQFESDEATTIQVISLIVNGGFVDIQAGDLRMSVAGNGRLGYVDLQSQIGQGCTFKNSYELIADCGIIAGFSSEEVYSAVRQQTDFYVIEYPHFVTDTIAGMQVRANFTDTIDFNSQNLQYVLNAYADNQDFVILEYSILNNSYETLENFYFGLFADFDLIEPVQNNSFYDSVNEFMYCTYLGENSLYAGMKLLTRQTAKNYSLVNAYLGDGNIDISDGFSDNEKFYMSSHNATTNDTADVVQYTGAGPFVLPYMDTTKVAIAFFAASSYNELLANMNHAIQKYENMNANTQDLVENASFNNLCVFPNPASSVLNIAVDNEEFKLEIYNSLGGLVLREKNVRVINVAELPAGFYNIVVYAEGKVLRTKFVKAE